MWSVSFCSECGKAGKCYCRRLGTSVLDYSYEYVFICGSCKHTETIKEIGGCWSGPSTKCPLCHKSYKVHQTPPEKLKV